MAIGHARRNVSRHQCSGIHVHTGVSGVDEDRDWEQLETCDRAERKPHSSAKSRTSHRYSFLL